MRSPTLHYAELRKRHECLQRGRETPSELPSRANAEGHIREQLETEGRQDRPPDLQTGFSGHQQSAFSCSDGDRGRAQLVGVEDRATTGAMGETSSRGLGLEEGNAFMAYVSRETSQEAEGYEIF